MSNHLRSPLHSSQRRVRRLKFWPQAEDQEVQDQALAEDQDMLQAPASTADCSQSSGELQVAPGFPSQRRQGPEHVSTQPGVKEETSATRQFKSIHASKSLELARLRAGQTGSA